MDRRQPWVFGLFRCSLFHAVLVLVASGTCSVRLDETVKRADVWKMVDPTLCRTPETLVEYSTGETLSRR